MIYDLAQVCKEWLDENNIDQKEVERLKKLQEEEEREVFKEYFHVSTQ
jgi:hypothetical protein